MRARVKKTNEIVKIRPSTKEPNTWITEDGKSFVWEELEPLRVESANFVGTVSAIPFKVNTSASGGISEPNEKK